MSAMWSVTKVVLYVVLIGIVIYLTLWAYMVYSMKRVQRETHEAISKIQLNCVDGTKQEIHPWSTGGYTISCRNGELINGEWQAWKLSHLSIKGQYVNGHKHGSWFFYNQEGEITREVHYREGVDINGNIHTPQ